MNVVQVDYGLNPHITDPDQLLERYATLTGWSEALLAAGAGRVAVIQRFVSDARIVRNGVTYVFRRDLHLSSTRRWSWPARLHKAVYGERPDVVHVNGLEFAPQTWLLRRQLRVNAAIVMQDHASGHPPRRSIKPLAAIKSVIRKTAMHVADGFFFTADAQAHPWRSAGFILPHQAVYEVVESSTDLRPMPRAEARLESGVEGDPAVLWVGRLNQNKDPLTVLDGFELAIAALPSASLTMVYGDGDLVEAVKARIQRSALLGGRVRLVGRIPHRELAAYYSAADLFVLGSHHEGSGYSLIEACACGAVPVVTRIPAFQVITGQGEIGALWDLDDASACARALVSATVNRPLNRDRVAGHFERVLSWRTIGAVAVAAYQDAVKRHAARTK